MLSMIKRRCKMIRLSTKGNPSDYGSMIPEYVLIDRMVLHVRRTVLLIYALTYVRLRVIIVSLVSNPCTFTRLFISLLHCIVHPQCIRHVCCLQHRIMISIACATFMSFYQPQLDSASQPAQPVVGQHV